MKITDIKFSVEKIRNRFISSLVFVALIYNLTVSWKVFSNIPLSDPASYPEIAKVSKFFYDTGIREPVQIYIVKFFMLFGLNDILSVRAATTLIAAFFGVLLFRFIFKRYGFTASMVAGFVFAANPYMGYYSLQGVNNLTSGFFLMLFVYFLTKKEYGRGNLIYTSLFAALSMLTRLENILIVFLILASFVLINFSKTKLRFSLLIFAFSFVAVLPYPLHQAYKYKSPTHSHNMAARFWTNTEKNGPRSVQRYKDGPMSISGFLFRDGISGAALSLGKGYFKSFFHYIPRILYYKTAFFLFILGFIVTVLRKKYFLASLLPIMILPVVFIAGIDQISKGSGIELRFYINVLWLLGIYAGLGVNTVAVYANKKLEKLAVKK
ncbi:MAG: glycosyltransferase family 39 protein [Elusimicrobia bacterium]|nr:glycosyltransferase family 39 protein [Elusimicrobiota bacterium]